MFGELKSMASISYKVYRFYSPTDVQDMDTYIWIFGYITGIRHGTAIDPWLGNDRTKRKNSTILYGC